MSAEELRYDPVRNAYIHEPKNKLVIKELWAWVSVDPSDGNEGVLARTLPGLGGIPMMMPFMGADEARMRSLLPEARRIKAASTNKNPIRLVRFTERTTVMEI